MGIFDWFKKSSADQELQKAMADVAVTLFPGGHDQVRSGGEHISRLLNRKLSAQDAGKLFGSVMYLAVYGKDRSPDRMRASIMARGDGLISAIEAMEIYKFVLSQIPPSVSERKLDSNVCVDVNNEGPVTLVGPRRSLTIGAVELSVLIQVARQAGWKDTSHFFDSLGRSMGGAVASDADARSLGLTLQLEMTKRGISNSSELGNVRDFVSFCFDGGFEISSALAGERLNQQPKNKPPAGTHGKAEFDATIRAIIRDVNSIDLKAAGGFKDVTLNELEVRFFLAWAVEVAFRGLRNYEKHLKASACVVRETLAELQKHSSNPDSVQDLFQKRFEEYSKLFTLRDGEEASAPLLRTCKRVAENVTGETDPHIAKIMAVTTYWWPTATSYPKILVDLDREGKVIW